VTGPGLERRWLVVGAAGMLGVDLVDVLSAGGEHVTGLGRDRLDVRDAAACRRAVVDYDVVVNAAAYTAVDEAETHEAEAFAVNALGAANLARACARAGARLIHVSTDYVFNGMSATEPPASPYAEDSPLGPHSAYGRTKAAGEWAVRAEHDDVLLLRTAWLYGAHGPCFPRTIAEALADRDVLDVVDDQLGQPTWTRDVAALMLALVRADALPGTYHATSQGMTSWHGFAQQVAVAVGADPERVRPTTSDAFRRAAPRPPFSALAHTTLLTDVLRERGVTQIGDWRERFTEAAPEVLAVAGHQPPSRRD
jgi:dTDP-4-dehydrorhamnose reductase